MSITPEQFEQLVNEEAPGWNFFTQGNGANKQARMRQDPNDETGKRIALLSLALTLEEGTIRRLIKDALVG